MHCMHIHQRDIRINTFKAIKDIAAGQEILVAYGGADWFKRRNIPYADVDYASTMWRPDLHPLPCRQKVAQATGADGRDSFFVREAVPSGTVLEVSLCLEVSVIAVQLFPVLRDFVLTGQTENLHTGVANNAALPHTNTPPVLLQTPAGNLNGYLYFISPLMLFQCPNP